MGFISAQMELVFATHNMNKAEEVRKLLPPGFTLLTLRDIGCTEDIPETSDTLEGNARIKALHVAEHYNRSCFADDTGLVVPSLGGAPGVYSARYAGPGKNAADNISKLLKELQDKQDRSAYFRTVIVLAHGHQEFLFEGMVHGQIIEKPRGEGGFGYDPVFVPEGYSETFAELPMAVKNEISHRGIAFTKLLSFLENKGLTP